MFVGKIGKVDGGMMKISLNSQIEKKKGESFFVVVKESKTISTLSTRNETFYFYKQDNFRWKIVSNEQILQIIWVANPI